MLNKFEVKKLQLISLMIICNIILGALTFVDFPERLFASVPFAAAFICLYIMIAKNSNLKTQLLVFFFYTIVPIGIGYNLSFFLHEDALPKDMWHILFGWIMDIGPLL